MQEADSERRIQILRGQHIEPPPPPADHAEGTAKEAKQDRRDDSGRHDRKRRRIAGEDDTDREIRIAREDQANLLPSKKVEMQMTSKKSSDAPLVDTEGHINLFPVEHQNRKDTKNAEVEGEKARKKKEYEDQFTMRFSNAAGFKQAVDRKPWYEDTDGGGRLKETVDMPSKDVWGNEDPRRKERERVRMADSDPLAMMRNGAAGVREAEKQRMKWKLEKAQEIQEIKDSEKSRKKRRRRREAEDVKGSRLSDSDVSRNSDVEMVHHHSHQHTSREKDRLRSHRHSSRAHRERLRAST